MSSCIKYFIVYRALSHGFNAIKKERNSWKIDKAVRLQIYLLFKVEKTGGGK